MQKSSKKTWIQLIVGFFSGIANGFFGSAGGIITVEALELQGMEEKNAHATALLAILPLSLISAFFYAGSGYLNWNALLFLAIGSLAGGILGALLLKKASPKFINWLFTLLILACGIRMLF